MLILVLPVTSIFLGLWGFYVWHRQLVRKRHFEIADAALSAFYRAEAAIAHARAPSLIGGEGTTRKRDQLELPGYGGWLDRLYIPIERLKAHAEAFDELERAAVNVDVHFGIDLADHLREPLRAHDRIATATALRMGNVGIPAEAKASRALACEWEAMVYSGAATSEDVDQLSIELKDAKQAVETSLRPFVEAPTFGEFLLVSQVRSIVHRILQIPRRWLRPGYGRIKVYATIPVTSPTADET